MLKRILGNKTKTQSRGDTALAVDSALCRPAAKEGHIPTTSPIHTVKSVGRAYRIGNAASRIILIPVLQVFAVLIAPETIDPKIMSIIDVQVVGLLVKDL